MDNSDTKPSAATSPAASNQMWVMTRALASAVLFGFVGSRIGKWLGQRGNDPRNKMAEPIMKWSMGGFWGLLAAYSSLKASESENLHAAPEYTPSTVTLADTMDMKASAQEMPQSVVQVAAAQNHGNLQEMIAQHRA